MKSNYISAFDFLKLNTIGIYMSTIESQIAPAKFNAGQGLEMINHAGKKEKKFNAGSSMFLDAATYLNIIYVEHEIKPELACNRSTYHFERL